MSLADISDERGRFGVFAIDHRDSLRAFLAPDDPDSLTAEEITALKQEMVTAISPLATGVMLEPEYSIPQVSESGALHDGVGFIAALESQGYLGRLGESPTTVLDGWSVEQAAASGAAAAKLLLPYHPDRPLAAAQQQMAAGVIADCRRVGIPLVLEPLFYDLEDPRDRPRVVLSTAATFTSLGPDLLKLPFPIDITIDDDEDHWFAACRTISETVAQPWTMLSGGGSFEDYVRQLTVAMAAGCRGFMVGRALWGEAAKAAPADRSDLLLGQVSRRMAQLRDLIEA